jgi:2-hydroxy-6-oxonona-2,4-dienedioate hydrolase
MNPLVLVHGAGVSPRYFEPLRGVLARTTVAPDLRSCSDLPGMVAVLEAALDAAALERVDLLANSFGCQIVAELALRRPQRVRRLVFVGPTVDRNRRNLVSQAARLALDAVREPPSLVALVLRDSFQAGPLRVLRMTVSAVGDRLEAKLPAMDAPLLVVRGERDALCPQDWAEEVVGFAPDARLAVIHGAAHAAHYSHPSELAALVRPFLEEPD